MKYLKLLLLIGIGFMLSTCTKEDLTNEDIVFEDEYIPIIKYTDNAVILDVKKHSVRDVKVLTDKIILAKNIVPSQNLKVGNILVSPMENFDPKYFYIRKIIDVQDDGNEIVIKTQRARLHEAFKELYVRISEESFLRDESTDLTIIDYTIPQGFKNDGLGVNGAWVEMEVGNCTISGGVKYGIHVKWDLTFVMKTGEDEGGKYDIIGVERMTENFGISLSTGTGVNCLFGPELPNNPSSLFQVRPRLKMIFDANVKGEIDIGGKMSQSFLLMLYEDESIPFVQPNKKNVLEKGGFYGKANIQGAAELCVELGAFVGLGAGIDNELEVKMGMDLSAKYCGGVEVNTSGLNCYTEPSFSPSFVAKVVFPGIEEKSITINLSKLTKKTNYPNCDFTPECDLGIFGEESFIINCSGTGSEDLSESSLKLKGKLTSNKNGKYKIYIDGDIINNKNNSEWFSYNKDIETADFDYRSSAIITIEDKDSPDQCSRNFTIYREDYVNNNCNVLGCFYDGTINENYNYIKIGNNYWMNSNLKEVGGEQDGTNPERYYSLKQLFNQGDLDFENSSYNDLLNLEGAQGLCPNGYHIPTKGEWYSLLMSINYVGTDMINVEKWVVPSSSEQKSSGFCVVPTGYIFKNDLIKKDSTTVFWTSTPAKNRIGSFHAIEILLDKDGSININEKRSDWNIVNYSCRCVKDK